MAEAEQRDVVEAAAACLRDENACLREEVSRLRAALAAAGRGTGNSTESDHAWRCGDAPTNSAPGGCAPCGDVPSVHAHGHGLPGGPPAYAPDNHSLTKGQVERYSRQLLLPSFGLAAQEGLCGAKVLVVGCGGLGSPAALYLAAAGVGTLGLVDHDVVEVSNLHRQVIHSEGRVGVHKAHSAAASCRALNSSIRVITHAEGLSPPGALAIVSGYDVVLDCSDNPPTRYLISDACVVAGKPLVSAAAVGTDGQLTVYNHGPDAPCYRCLFPEAPAPENCSRCSDAGVLGVVPGVMGALQALEAIKIVSHKGSVMSRRMLVFDALTGKFMTVNLRPRSPSCIACGEEATLTADTLQDYDYIHFSGQDATDGAPSPLALIPDAQRVTPAEAKALLSAAASSSLKPVLIDVRPELQFKLFHLPGAVNVPIEELEGRVDEVQRMCGLSSTTAAAADEPSASDCGGAAAAPGGTERGGDAPGGDGESPAPLYVICRRGNASQEAVAALRAAGLRHAFDVIGGMTRWAADVDGSLPVL
ncbi:hypothetical protein FOA52_011198 [Chlamydomonas sp. UWO 241]|nr:hypothetical protein FOA52_011198 [Chlamydomonas sp. UWO 241]